MSYTIENTNQLFLVTKHFDDMDLHIIMSKREVQEQLKSAFAHSITSIKKFELTPKEEVSKKYFLPKDWQKIHPKSINYRIYKEIAKANDNK
mgnify:CR=1 FL=1